jgi:NAD(P)-dependent dehydrogenase (short-subunit alcohol dehydrogenase family)
MTTNQKVVLITGTSSGFGLLASVDFARAGFQVIATMRDVNKATQLMKAANEEGVSANMEIRPLDVTKFDELPGILNDVVAAHGRIDVLVNNAGYALAGFAEDISLEELKTQFDTNFFGHVALTKAVLPIMRKQRSGHIIMVSSIAGLTASPVLSSYASSKHALEGWSEALRIEMHSLGIRVVLVEPGAFDTDIWVKNAKMGAQAVDNSSINKERSLRFREVVQKKVQKADARIVSRLIVKIAQAPNPKLRYLIGRDAFVRKWVKRLLPWRTYEKLVEKATNIAER